MTGTAAETFAKDNGIKFESSGEVTNISAADVTLEEENYIYDGTEKTPSVTVKLGEKVLVPDTDYTVTYLNNLERGTAKVVISGRGSYVGKIEKEFYIWKPVNVPMLPADWSVILEQTNYIYDGKPKTPSVILKDNHSETQIIPKEPGFTVTYKDNIEVGTATVIVEAIYGYGYQGTLTATFTISKADDVKKIDISKATVTLSQTSYTYDGKAKTPTVTVTLDGKTLALNTDYTVTYSNNVNVGTAKATVTGKGNYTGSKTTEFAITKAAEEPKKIDISKATVTLSKTSYTYDGKAKKPSVSVKLDGKTLVLNTDYTVSYSNNTKAGTAKATVTGKGNYTGSKSVNFTIAKAGEQPDSKITCKKTVYKVTYGAKPFKINATSKSKMTFTSSKPKIAAVDKNTGKVTIKNTGVATITIKAGKVSKKVTIKVSPKKPSVKSAKTAKGKKLTVKWAKDKMASGYQVQISTDKNFRKNVKSKNLSTTSYTFTKLKTGKKYYVRIRSYKKSGKETLYSAWSKAKLSSKIKK